MNSRNKIFISYSKTDWDIAKRLYDDMNKFGVESWLDSEKLLPGQNWKVMINQAIKKSSYFIALLSNSTISKKGFVRKELKLALDILDEYSPTDIFIIPVRIDDCEPNDENILSLHWVDLFPSYEEGLKKIFKVILPKEDYIQKNIDNILNKANQSNAIQPENPNENRKKRFNLRSDPIYGPEKEHQSFFKLKNKLQFEEYIENDFNDNNDGTITDYATNLMWQQSGSDICVSFDDAISYISSLNRNIFGGFNDWRIPTMDELRSLLKSKKQSNGLYISTIFDKTQNWCWSSDIRSNGRAKYLFFLDFSDVQHALGYNTYYIRAVRSIS